MAARFKTVSSKLCSNYLKTPGALYSPESSYGALRVKHFKSPSQVKHYEKVPLLSCDMLPNSLECYKYNTYPLSHIIPLSRTSVTLQDLAQCRNQDYLCTLPSLATKLNKNIVYCTGRSSDSTSKEPQNVGRPSEEKLQEIFDTLSNNLPGFFMRPLQYHIYHDRLICENNIRGTRTVGIGSYASQASMLRVLGHLKFAHVRLEVLKITMHPEESTIKCRWRIVGVPAAKVMFQFWKYIGKLQETVDKPPTWYDGFSIYYVNADGQVFKHVIDKMQPDDDKVVNDKDGAGISKLALYLGLLPEQEKTIYMNALNEYCKSSVHLN